MPKKTVKRPLKADLVKGVYFRVEGTAGQSNAISWNVLQKMGENLQELIKSFGKYDLDNVNAPSPEFFEIELFDFKPGSAVPAFRLKRNQQEIIGTPAEVQMHAVAKQFDEMMAIAETGDYAKLKQIYKTDQVRNEVASQVYGFVNAPGNSPISIVKPTAKGLAKVYKINKFTKKAYDSIYVHISDAKSMDKQEKRILAYGQVSMPAEKGKGKKAKILEIYKSNETAMSFAPHKIVLEDKVYNLHTPLMCHFHKEEDYYIIENPQMDLYATGLTEGEAEENFYKEFDLAYNRFNEVEDTMLSDRLLRAKNAINLIVKNITKD